MATEVVMKKRCSQEEELKKNHMKYIIRQCSSLSIKHHDDDEYKASWSDLDWDLLREINNKVCNYRDATAFRGVCKSWRAAGRVKRAGDVLPWLIRYKVNYNNNTISYNMCEPEYISPPDDKSSSSGAAIEISGTIYLDDYFLMQRLSSPTYVRYVDGWLLITVSSSGSSYLLLYSLAAPKTSSFTLPPLHNCSGFVHLGLSTTTPDSPDCVFLTLWSTPIFSITLNISIFRHGDTHWTTITHSLAHCFGKYIGTAAVFIHRVFYFLISDGIGSFDLDISDGIGSYDLDTGKVKLDCFKYQLHTSGIHSFFGLDGDLVLAYYDRSKTFDIKKYDWMNKVWVPLPTLPARSLYLNINGSLPYVDDINYYGIVSSNIVNPRYHVDQYSLRIRFIIPIERRLHPSDGGLVRWGGHKSRTCAMWVSPPPPHLVLMQK